MKTTNTIVKDTSNKNSHYYILYALLFLLCISCSSEDEEEVTISLDGPVLSVSDFSGNWTATGAIFEDFDGSQRLNLVQEGGSASLSVQSNGRFSINLDVPGQGTEVISGELGFNEGEWGDRLIVIFDGEPKEDYEVYNISLENGILYLSGVTTFDFTGGGTEEPAVIDLILTRS